MPGDGNLHSRVVVWLKVGLPLAALALLSTLFLISNRIDPTASIPYADVDIEDRLRQPRMTAPVLATMTRDGSAVTLTAAEARPPQAGAEAGPEGAPPGGAGADRGSASDVLMQVALTDGSTARLLADSARIDAAGDTVALQGRVVLDSSTGWTVTAPALTARLDRTALDSPGPVRAEGPAGTLEAGTMALAASGPGATAYVLVFKDGVKLLYRPAQ
jgi:lipopolysaccharide export system protein LptC